MMEIALSPYKPLSGKKAKKGQSNKAPPEVSTVGSCCKRRLITR